MLFNDRHGRVRVEATCENEDCVPWFVVVLPAFANFVKGQSANVVGDAAPSPAGWRRSNPFAGEVASCQSGDASEHVGEFGKKPRLGPRPAVGTQPVVDPEDPEVQKRRMRERLMLTVAKRTEHFEKTYKVTAILDNVALVSGHSGPIKVGDKLEECVVVTIDPSAVVLKGSVGGGEGTVVACKTFEMAGRLVAKVQGRLLHVGDKYNGGIVKEIGKDKIILTPGARAAGGEKLEFTVRLKIK